MYKAPTTPCSQDIILNHFSYLEIVEELLTYSNRQIYYGDSRDNDHSVQMEYPSSGPSSSDDSFSLLVPPYKHRHHYIINFVILYLHIQ